MRIGKFATIDPKPNVSKGKTRPLLWLPWFFKVFLKPLWAILGILGHAGAILGPNLDNRFEKIGNARNFVLLVLLKLINQLYSLFAIRAVCLSTQYVVDLGVFGAVCKP